MMQTPSDDDDDATLFRAAVSGVRKLTSTHQRPTAHTPLSTRPRPITHDEHSMLSELPLPDGSEAGDSLSYRADGVQDAVVRKLRRGQYRIGTELDLHGLNREQAGLAVVQFLARCQDRRVRCVRIIHGKGSSSPNSTPVLKSYLASWLRHRNDVLAYCSARPADGGTGAVYVLLRVVPAGS